LIEIGQPPYRADQVWSWLYLSLAPDFDAMSNLPCALRMELSRRWSFPGLHEVTRVYSRDGRTQKVLFELHDGETIESVLMHYERRRTVCVSTQVGCALGCDFCATGKSGFRRDLTTGEIVEQVLFFARDLLLHQRRVNNVVFMGMGEPLLNYENTRRAITILNDRRGFDLGARRMTVSTVGVVPGIDRLGVELPQIGLSISLHAPDDSLRDRLVPINLRYPLSELLGACRRYVSRTNRRVTFEYALMDGVNDSADQARELAGLLGNLLCHVNLIPLNAIAGSDLRQSKREQVDLFRSILESYHVPVTVRLGRGVDIEAGCGQLRSQKSL
jgi:23S rRNA (adenine2503-C2)-methyltransferase